MSSAGATRMGLLVLAISMSTGCGVLTGAGADSPTFVITQVPVGRVRLDLESRTDPDARYPDGSRIVQVVGRDAEGRVTRILSEGLAAAGAPDLSFAADAIVFAGREEPGRPWSIYERRFRDSRPRLVVDEGRDCIDPAYLPGGRVVFACRTSGGWSLHTAGLDGGDITRITFGPGSAFGPETLQDGRILFTIWDPTAGGSASGLFTVNPDGALIEPFAGIHGEQHLELHAIAAGDGRILFLSVGQDGSPALAEQIEERYPDDTRRMIPIEGIDPTSLEPLGHGAMLIAGQSRRAGNESDVGSGVYSLQGGQRTPDLIFDDPEWDEIEAVSVTPEDPPRGRPSSIDGSLATGQIVCYDASRTATAQADLTPVSVAVLAGDQASQVIPLHSDSSFYLEVPADVPLRIRTLDRSGNEIATSAPFWVRPGEVRACFGCHAGHDWAPVNRPVQALADPPLSVPSPVEHSE